jgi:hypothetical protein
MASILTHILIAMKTFKGDVESDDYLDFLVGSIVPDLEFLIMCKIKEDCDRHIYTNKFLKQISSKKKFKFFKEGIENHLKVDGIIHAYIYKKIEEIDSSVDPLIVHGMIEFELNQKIAHNHPELKKVSHKVKERMLSDHIVTEMANFFKISEKITRETIRDAYLASRPIVSKHLSITALVLLILSKKKKYKEMPPKDLKKSSKLEKIKCFKEVRKIVAKDYEFLTNGIIKKVMS